MKWQNETTLAISTSSLVHTGRQRPQEDRRDTAETGNQEELSAYQEMTPKEAADVLKLMEEYEPLVNNSIAFAEQLSRDLHVLDEVRDKGCDSTEKKVPSLKEHWVRSLGTDNSFIC